jgi:HPt (histidine-containing phosphotransfer) domain-containing protein
MEMVTIDPSRRHDAVERPCGNAEVTDSAPLESGSTHCVWSFPREITELVKTDRDLGPELISLFLADAATRLDALDSAFARQDSQAIRGQAHSLKGAAFQMGAAAFSTLCAAIERCGSSQAAECRLLIDETRKEFVLVRRVMEEYLVDPEDGRLER